MPDLFQSKNTYQRENPGHQGNSSVLLPHKKPAAENNLFLLRSINRSTSCFYEALCKWKCFSAERTRRMEDHRPQDRRQKKKKVEIYTYRTASVTIIPKASFVCVPFSGLFALSTSCFLCTTWGVRMEKRESCEWAREERERAKQNKYKSICVSVEHLRDWGCVRERERETHTHTHSKVINRARSWGMLCELCILAFFDACRCKCSWIYLSKLAWLRRRVGAGECFQTKLMLRIWIEARSSLVCWTSWRRIRKPILQRSDDAALCSPHKSGNLVHVSFSPIWKLPGDKGTDAK